MFNKAAVVVSILLAFSLVLGGCGKKAQQTTEVRKLDYSTNPLKIIVYTLPGTGGDIMNRKMAELLQKKYGWKVEVVNEPGERGATAMKQVWDAPHDGHTVLGQSENMLGLSVYGLTDKTMKDWTHFEMSHETSMIVVRSDSPYKTINDLVQAAKQKPGVIRVGHNGVGRSFYLKAKILEKVAGVKFDLKEYKVNEIAEGLLNGEVDALTTPTQLIEKAKQEGKVRPLIVTDLNSFDFGSDIGKVDSITKFYPEAKNYLPLDGALGMSMPADTPKEIVSEFGKAFNEVMNSQEMKEFVEKRGNVMVNLWGDDAKNYVETMESNFAWLAKEIGLAKVDPETLGIPKSR